MNREDAGMGAQWKTKIKETAAAAKGRIFTKLSKEIMVAARAGADPDMNPRLRMAMEQAKKASVPKDTVERAIKKGAGLVDEGVHYEKLTYEGFAPHHVPVIVECLTDNVNRTVTSIRMLFRKGQLGTSGSVSWDFDHLGMIEATPETAGADPEVAAIEAGARDLEPGENGATLFYTDLSELDAVARALPKYGFSVQSAQLGYRPKNPVTLGGAERAEVEAFLEAIDADDDVQNVYAGLAE
jgi:YebC/PmpR family DNA-binding regulatory protein